MWRGRVWSACVAVLASGAEFLVSPAVAWAQDVPPMTYDKPVKTEIVTFMERMPWLNNGTRIKVIVTCSYYPRFAVEEVHDDGDEGEAIYTVPIADGIDPACEDPEVSNPKAVGEGAGWFVGVKNDLVVAAGPDTFDYGTAVTIFRALDYKVLLSDQVQVQGKSLSLRMSIKESKAGVDVRYDRIFAGRCSMVAQGEACVDQFVKQTGVGAQSFAECAASYRLQEEWWVKLDCTKSGRLDHSCLVNGLSPTEQKKWDTDPTVIAYPVQMFIPAGAPSVDLDYYGGSSAAVRSVPIVGGVVDCFPAE